MLITVAHLDAAVFSGPTRLDRASELDAAEVGELLRRLATISLRRAGQVAGAVLDRDDLAHLEAAVTQVTHDDRSGSPSTPRRWSHARRQGR